MGPCLFLLEMCCVGMLGKKTVDQMHWYHWGLCALLVKMLVLLDLSYSHTAIESLYIFAFLCLLACIALIDHYWLIIPDSGVVLFWFMAFPLSTVSLQERLFSVSIILLITLCLRKWKGNCIGWGDVKMLIRRSHKRYLRSKRGIQIWTKIMIHAGRVNATCSSWRLNATLSPLELHLLFHFTPSNQITN